MSNLSKVQEIEEENGKIPPKTKELMPWGTMCTNLVGPYTITDQKSNDRGINAMIVVDSAIWWFEIAKITDKTSSRISQINNNTWLSRYPRPRKIIFDNGNEFKKDFLPLLKDLSIKPTLTTIKNPQVNSILERVHQVVGYLLRAKNLQKYDFDDKDPGRQLLAN